MEQVDVFIAGGGLAGLVAAAAFGQAGFSVVLADPSSPPEAGTSTGADLRATAYLRPSRDLIAQSGLWSALEPHATPLEVLRIIDTVGWPPETRETRDFRADDMGEVAFGWNLPNWHARAVLARAIEGLPQVSLRFGVGFRSLVSRDAEAVVTLEDGTRLRARLAIAADGRGSTLRDAAGIGVQTTRYGQKALAFAVSHPEPHGRISTEIYNEGGAFTLVPGSDIDGRPASSVVWMNRGARALELQAMEKAEFESVMNIRSCGILGPLSLESKRQLWPVTTQHARILSSGRVALIAEAAHVMPPIGAQGLNTSLRDVAVLIELALKTPNDLGSKAMLSAYRARRSGDVGARLAAIDLFNRVCMSGNPPVQLLRLAGLRAVHGIAPLRQAVMRAGLGTTS